MRGSLIVLALLALVPVAGAQSLEPTMAAHVASPSELLMPDTGISEHRLTVDVTCPLRYDPTLGPWELKFKKVELPSYATVILNPASAQITFDPAKCADPAYKVSPSTAVLVTTNRQALAFETFTVTIQATLSQGTHSNSTTAKIHDTNGYFPLTQVIPERLFMMVKPGEAFTFANELKNLGNGPASIEVTSQPVGKNHLEYVAEPAATTLPYQDSVTVLLRGQPPSASGVVNYIASTQAWFRTSSPDPRGSLTDETTITFAVQVANLAQASAPATLGVVVSFALAAMLRRPPRDRDAP